VLARVAIAALLVQGIAAAVSDRSLETPNTSTIIARNLAQGGRYEVPAVHRPVGDIG